jgi:hypothetical protein
MNNTTGKNSNGKHDAAPGNQRAKRGQPTRNQNQNNRAAT